MSTIPAYPLQWPAGWKRTADIAQMKASFRHYEKQLSIAQAIERVRGELSLMRVHDADLVVSTNLQLRLDGFPRSDQREPDDKGVAVYWRDGSQDGWPMRCMAIDRYNRVADNLAAIAATLRAMRAIERHGGAEILDRAFTGFTALPGPSVTPWWEVLETKAHASTESVKATYQIQRSLNHPDKGGNLDRFHAVQSAWQSFCKERGISE